MPKKVSVIVPAYNEQESIEVLAERLSEVFAANHRYEFEVILIENGSTDRTYEKMLRIHEKDPRFKILRLSRNFRMDGGITAGLSHASGDAAVIMTAALKDPPELIKEFLSKWEEGYENVYGIVTKRPGTGLARRFNSQVFYWLINTLTGGVMPKNVSDFRLVDKKVYQTINGMAERNRYLRGLFVWAGFRSIGIEFERAPRFAGKSKAYTLQVIELALKGIFAYSYVPIKLITIMGIMISSASFSFVSRYRGESVLVGGAVSRFRNHHGGHASDVRLCVHGAWRDCRICGTDLRGSEAAAEFYRQRENWSVRELYEKHGAKLHYLLVGDGILFSDTACLSPFIM